MFPPVCFLLRMACLFVSYTKISDDVIAIAYLNVVRILNIENNTDYITFNPTVHIDYQLHSCFQVI